MRMAIQQRGLGLGKLQSAALAPVVAAAKKISAEAAPALRQRAAATTAARVMNLPVWGQLSAVTQVPPLLENGSGLRRLENAPVAALTAPRERFPLCDGIRPAKPIAHACLQDEVMIALQSFSASLCLRVQIPSLR